MKANAGGPTSVEKKRIHRFAYVPAKFVPRISLREDAFRKALGAVAAVRLHDFKHQFVHSFSIIAGAADIYRALGSVPASAPVDFRIDEIKYPLWIHVNPNGRSDAALRDLPHLLPAPTDFALLFDLWFVVSYVLTM
jgi:hypothetical protein